MVAEMDDLETMAADIANMVMAGDWYECVGVARSWYTAHCPRYDRDEVEVRCGWVGTALLWWDQLVARTRLPTTDRHYLDAAGAKAEFRKEVLRHWRNEPEVYRRRVNRIDATPCAESRVADVARRITSRNGAIA